MSDKKEMWVFGIAFAILIPTIFFPASSDLSVFMLGGKLIANGSELYKDYFDLKAPLTYYFFAAISVITNDSIVLTRIIDLFLTLLFLVSANFIFKSLKLHSRVRQIFTIIFSMSYVSLNYSNTLQCETITYLPMIWYLYFVAKPSKYSTIVKGILLGVIISFKYTLGIVFVAEFFFADYYATKGKFFLSKATELGLAVTLLFITFLPTIVQGNWIYFNDVMIYIDTYKNYPPLGIEFVKSFIKELGALFGDMYSVLFTATAFVGLMAISKQKVESKRRFLNLVIVFLLLLLFSFIIERKPTLYQFSRVYPFLLLLSSLGLYYFFKVVKFGNKYILAAVITIAILLSPLPRVVNLLKLPVIYFTQGERYLLAFSHEGGTGNFEAMLDLKQYTASNSNNFIYMNTGSHEFLRMTNSHYKYPQSAFYLAEYDNKHVKSEFKRDLQKVDYFIVQNNDEHYVSFFNYGSSYDNLFRDSSLKSLVEQNFTLDTIIADCYLIYTKKPLGN
jgi:hypothetical protein